MNFNEAKKNFNQLFKSVDKAASAQFLRWLAKHVAKKQLEYTQSNNDAYLNSICDDLRALVPFELIISTQVDRTRQLTSAPTIHVDSFLCDDAALDVLESEGRVSRHYCVQCGSVNTAPTSFISHSMSLMELKFVFQYLLADMDLRGKRVLDVGSRLGAVLYGAYVYTTASVIVGVELDGALCNAQQQIIDKYQMQDRIKVVNDDICNQMELLATADLVVLNNVFEYFLSPDDQRRVWTFIFTTVRKPGTRIVSSPSLSESFSTLQMSLDEESWVSKIDTSAAIEAAACLLTGDQDTEDFESFHLYTVLPTK